MGSARHFLKPPVDPVSSVQRLMTCGMRNSENRSSSSSGGIWLPMAPKRSTFGTGIASGCEHYRAPNVLLVFWWLFRTVWGLEKFGTFFEMVWIVLGQVLRVYTLAPRPCTPHMEDGRKMGHGVAFNEDQRFYDGRMWAPGSWAKPIEDRATSWKLSYST